MYYIVFLGGPLRFPKSLIFWLTADQDVLDKRISTRVDGMVGKGLIHEIQTFFKNHVQEITLKNQHDAPTKDEECEISREREQLQNSKNNEVKDSIEAETYLVKSYQEGLFQAIGFKEFHAYLSYMGTCEETRKRLLNTSLEKLKQITIKYSKKQIRWVLNRIIGRPPENAVSVYKLDATHIDSWNVDVLAHAKKITHSFVNDEDIKYRPYACYDDHCNDNTEDKNRKHVCEDCDGRIIVGDNAWTAHLKSKRHKKMKTGYDKRQQEKRLKTT